MDPNDPVFVAKATIHGVEKRGTILALGMVFFEVASDEIVRVAISSSSP